MRDIETRAWNCGEWSADFHQYIYELCEHADTIGDGMSTEQLVAYAILLERERCANYVAEKSQFVGPDGSAYMNAIAHEIRSYRGGYPIDQ